MESSSLRWVFQQQDMCHLAAGWHQPHQSDLGELTADREERIPQEPLFLTKNTCARMLCDERSVVH